MHIDVILLERVAKLGQMGDVVRVKSGYARNFLIPYKKALRATEANKNNFAQHKVEIEAQNLENRGEAEKVSEKLTNKQVVLLRQASESGQLYGSVAAKDITEFLAKNGFTLDRRQIQLNDRFKSLGIFDVHVALHAEVTCTVKLNIAKSADEASQQWTRYENGEPVLMTAAEEETLEEHRQAESRMRRDQEKAEAAAAKAQAQAQTEAETSDDTAEPVHGSSEESTQK